MHSSPQSSKQYRKCILPIESQRWLLLGERVVVLSGSQFTVTGMKPIWAPFKIMQINISPIYSFFSVFPLFTLLSAHRAFLSFLRVEWKVSLLLRIKAEEKPGPGLIHVAHTGGMLCMDNWLLKQHGHRWILMVLPKCHLTDVTAAPILKRLVSKAPIQAHSSPTVSGRDSAVCQASISEGQILHLQPYLSRTVHPLPEGHWTFPIIGIYHSAFKVEIKSVGMVRGEKTDIIA